MLPSQCADFMPNPEQHFYKATAVLGFISTGNNEKHKKMISSVFLLRKEKLFPGRPLPHISLTRSELYVHLKQLLAKE